MAAAERITGLTAAAVAQAQQKHGPNALPDAPSASWITVFLRQFSSFLILILAIAAAVALALGEALDAATIGIVVILNAVLGFVQEWKAETALSSLRNMLAPQAIVIRDNQEQLIPARDIVPGDVLVLRSGARIAADATLLQVLDLQIDESVLTGESLPVSKDSNAADTARVYAGTSVTEGRGLAQVTAIGAKTEFGRIAKMTGAAGIKQTNLQSKLGQLARYLGIAALVVAAGVAGLGLLLGRDGLEMVMTGLSLAVAMVPEGLPAVVTITLALGATAMVRQNALARRLQAVETLGAASVICTDKTGTLTENKMTATRVWTLDQSYTVTGTGYDPVGEILANGSPVQITSAPILSAILQTGRICSHTTLRKEGDRWTFLGSPTEGALATLAMKGLGDPPAPPQILSEIPFSSDRKRMSVIAVGPDGEQILTKGAPEHILDVCSKVAARDGDETLTAQMRATIEDAYIAMADDGLRVIAMAQKTAGDHKITEADMTFLGMVGLIDPPRSEVHAAVASARSAGLRVIMITGDGLVTARAIARQLGLPADTCLTGPDLEAMDADALGTALKGNVLFARTTPKHKMRIVAALQAQDQIVAMTGDGVNDAPALKQADIGVSMGIRGTDVARDASDLVLLDDNFATIVRAVSEGRRQFANVQKFVRYLLSSNAGEVVALVVNIIIGGPIIFLATQILWMNLVTDGVTAVALGLEKAEPDHMLHPPRHKASPILGKGGIAIIIILGTYTGLSSLWIFNALLDQGVELARTAAFTAMVVFEKASVFAFRSLRHTVWRIGWFSNPFLLLALALTLGAQMLAVYWPPLQTLLRTVPIGWAEWQMIGLFVLPIIIVPELLKATFALRPRAGL